MARLQFLDLFVILMVCWSRQYVDGQGLFLCKHHVYISLKCLFRMTLHKQLPCPEFMLAVESCVSSTQRIPVDAVHSLLHSTVNLEIKFLMICTSCMFFLILLCFSLATQLYVLLWACWLVWLFHSLFCGHIHFQGLLCILFQHGDYVCDLCLVCTLWQCLWLNIFQVCPSMASLLPTTAMCSCRVLVRVMLVLCSAQLTALPAVQLHLADLESGSTLTEGGFPLWILFPLLLPSHSIETEVLHWFVWTEDPTRVCQWCTLECTAVKYPTKTMWTRHCVWEHILQRVQVSFFFCF